MKKCIDFLKNILKENNTIIVGVSGGPDSMCLLELLTSLQKEYHLQIIVAHINHGIRSESDEESNFVERICNEKKCIFETKKLNFSTQKDFENKARKERYSFYELLIKKYNANYLMTAHHADDLMETILMRLTRGSNFYGYRGFSRISIYENYKVVRPLIFVTKEEIDAYNKENDIEYRIDQSNFSLQHTRNRYRLNLLPFLKKENKEVHNKFLKFSLEIEEINAYLDKEVKRYLTKVMNYDKVDLHEFKKLDFVLQKRMIEYILKEEYKNDIYLLNDKHIHSILQLCNSNLANTSLNLPNKKVIVKSYNLLYFKHTKEEKGQVSVLEDKVILNKNSLIKKIKNTSILKSNYIIRLNSSEIEFPLKVRYRKEKDVMHVKNMIGTKKVKDIFMNAKVSKDLRETWPIVVDAKDTILWIPGLKKSNFDKNIDEFYDIIYEYVMSEETKYEKK